MSQMIAPCPGATIVPVESALALSVSTGFPRDGPWNPRHRPCPHQRQRKVLQCAQLAFPGFSKAASRRSLRPPFQLPHANPASLVQLSGAKVTGVMPIYRPAVPAIGAAAQTLADSATCWPFSELHP